MPIGRCASCKEAETALAVKGRGRLGNALIELENQVTMAMSNGTQAVGDPPDYVRYNEYDGPRGTAPWVCYAPNTGGKASRHVYLPGPLPVVTEGAHTLFYAYGPKNKIFQGEEGLYKDKELRDSRILANLFVESYLSLKHLIDPFLTANNMHNGFNAVHLRNLDGRCYKLASVSAELNAEVKPFLGRDVDKDDICKMTSDYIRASIKSQGGDLKLPLVLCHDRQQKEEAARIVKDFKAIVFEVAKNLTNCGTGGRKGRDVFCGSKEDQEVAKRIDLLLLMRSNTAVLNTGM